MAQYELEEQQLDLRRRIVHTYWFCLKSSLYDCSNHGHNYKLCGPTAIV